MSPLFRSGAGKLVATGWNLKHLNNGQQKMYYFEDSGI
jgi:hypothetical protein